MPGPAAEEIRIPFGKHKGKPLKFIPSSYLLWVAENSEHDYMATKADEVWQWREKFNEHWEDDK